MNVQSCAYSLPKAGNAEHEYEDAVCSTRKTDTKVALMRFAVADGATEASFSKSWARLLTRAFVKRRLDRLDESELAPLHRIWTRWFSRKELAWYAEEKARDGAYASLIGVELSDDAEDSSRLNWRAVAVGDSCLFLVHNDALLSSFPLGSAMEFNNHPILLSSVAEKNVDALAGVQEIRGKAGSNDRLFLMTDALACWFLHEHEQGGAPWQRLPPRDADPTSDPFADWVIGGERKAR